MPHPSCHRSAGPCGSVSDDVAPVPGGPAKAVSFRSARRRPVAATRGALSARSPPIPSSARREPPSIPSARGSEDVFSPRHSLQLRRLEDAPMFAVDDLTAGLTLKSQSELLGNSVPISADPPCRDNAAIADFHPAAERPVATFAASEGVQMPFNEMMRRGSVRAGIVTRLARRLALSECLRGARASRSPAGFGVPGAVGRRLRIFGPRPVASASSGQKNAKIKPRTRAVERSRG